MDIYFLAAVLISAVLVQAFTLLWYAPYLVGGQWRKALKRKEDAKIPAKLHVYSFFFWGIAAACFGYVTNIVLGLALYIDYLILGGLMFVAFALPMKIMHVLYSGQSKQLIFLDACHALLSYMIISAVFYFL